MLACDTGAASMRWPLVRGHRTFASGLLGMRSFAANLLHAREGQWSLVAQDRDDVTPLRAFPCQIGRHPGVPVRIIHPTVSLVHAELRRRGDESLELVDLSSRNGTFVNGARVTGSQVVHTDDLLQFGAAVLRLQNTTQGHTPLAKAMTLAIWPSLWRSSRSSSATRRSFPSISRL
jgi:pSer/pThr/pTyr-binding forkhead associated (FHA) protein